jgi:hypothetical protein
LLNVSALVAVLGLAFAVLTYVLDSRSQDRADRRAARAELTELVQSISELPRLYATLPTDQGSMLVAGTSAYTAELLSLVSQAERVVAESATVAGSGDYMAIANAHLQLGNYTRAVETFGVAEGMATDEGDQVVATAARRGLGLAGFASGAVEEGRRAFRRAVEMGDFDVVESVRDGNKVLTLFQWIGAEAATGNCEQAEALLADLKSSRPSQIAVAAENLDALVADLEGAVASCG